MNSELRDARKMFAPEKTCTVYSLLVTHVKYIISLYHFFRAGDALMVEPRARPASKIFEKSDDTEVFQYPPIKAAQLTTLPQVPHY